jgi:hypothetical protein
MARTTIDLDSSILAELRKRQATGGKTLSRLVSELLAQALAGQGVESAPLRWRSKPMGARVDLEDKDALSRLLDES